MKPAPFRYEAPESLTATLELLAEHGEEGKLLAGGQSLIPVMNFRLAQPAVLVDINGIPDLDRIEATAEGGVRIGAVCRLSQVERRSSMAKVAPLLHEAVPFIAHPQIRNRGTVGGSLAHADPAAELPAVALAAGARVKLQKLGAERWVEAGDFFTGLFATALEPNEILTEVELPPAPAGSGWAFIEVARRHGDYAQVGVAAMVLLDRDRVCRQAKLVYLSVGDGPVAAPGATGILTGEKWGEALVEAAVERAVSEEIDPAGDIHASAPFKRHLARVLGRRALGRAAARSARALEEG